jgi:hypothetical protein
MSWDCVILERCENDADLASAVERLFAQQRRTWSTFRDGEAALAAAETRQFVLRGGFRMLAAASGNSAASAAPGDATVVVQTNPGRRRSTHAKVDTASIVSRPCFLCSENMPAEERGVALGEFVVAPNPFPVLARHVTIPSREHRPQRLAGAVGPLLRLARALGPEQVVFYNGPRCGASAPDHFHLQACDGAAIPVFAELATVVDALGATEGRAAFTSFGRTGLLAVESQPDRLEAFVARVATELAGWPENVETPAEPMVNLLARFRRGRYELALFPRRAHRPSCFFADEPQRIAVSPAALEMAGMLVLSEPEQLERIDAAAIETLYREVSPSAETIVRVAEAAWS